MSGGFIVAILVSGFITGALARFALPGPDPMPIWLTTAIGLVGSIAGAVVGREASNDNAYAISFVSFGVAIALVAAYRHFVQKRPLFGPGALRFPERGIGVQHYRERLKRVGIDPEALRPDPARLQHARLLQALQELHRAGIIDDDELEAKKAAVEERQAR